MAPCAAFVNTIATTYVGGRDDHTLIEGKLRTQRNAECNSRSCCLVHDLPHPIAFPIRL